MLGWGLEREDWQMCPCGSSDSSSWGWRWRWRRWWYGVIFWCYWDRIDLDDEVVEVGSAIHPFHVSRLWTRRLRSKLLAVRTGLSRTRWRWEQLKSWTSHDDPPLLSTVLTIKHS